MPYQLLVIEFLRAHRATITLYGNVVRILKMPHHLK
nr:MAG TPA: hypothetical protein [Caudoviricetes sp.]